MARRPTFQLFIVALIIVAGSMMVSRSAFSADLDDSIDAELDAAAVSPAPAAPAASGESEVKDTPPTAAAPAAPPAKSDNVDDELKLDDEPVKAADAPAPSPTIEPENQPQAPAAKRTDVVIDAPNAAYEKRLGEITRGFKQVPDVNWDEIVGERRQENYSLQRGDTLWDISKTFFGDGFFWAKLWSQNGVIENPHQIVRGKAIRFVAGTEGEAPAIGVMDVKVASNSEVVTLNPLADVAQPPPVYREQAQSEISPEEMSNSAVVENDELIPSPEIPSAKPSKPPLKSLPKSFVESHVTIQSQYDSAGLDVPKTRNADKPATVYVNSFILGRSPDSIGKIDEIESQEKVAGTGQGVFVRLDKDVQQGHRITFVRKRSRPHGASGPVVDVLGIGVIDGTVKETSNTYHATVTTTIAPVEKGALVLDEAPPLITVDRNGRHGEANVTIVGAEYDDQRKNIGAHSIVYLNGGKDSGVNKGDILGIQSRRGTRRDTRYPDYKTAIAVLKIADVRDDVATGYVISANEPIHVGDTTSGELPEGRGGLHIESAAESAAAFGRKEPLDIK